VVGSCERGDCAVSVAGFGRAGRGWPHRYFDTAHVYVWATVDHDLQPLLEALNRLEAANERETK
jgi:hypothetical protein